MSTLTIIERAHAVAIRTDGDCVDAVIGRTIDECHRALIDARFEAFHGSIDELGEDLERDFPRKYQKGMAD